MACVGALIDHLIRERAASDFDDEGIASVDIRDIEILALCVLVYALCLPFHLNFICFRNEVMHINADALLWVRSAFFFLLLRFVLGHFKCLKTKVMPPSTLIKRRRDCLCLVRPLPHPTDTVTTLLCTGTLNGTKTTLGRALLRTWLLRPSLSLSVINDRHEAVECFMRLENIATATLMHSHLKGIKNMPRILSLLRTGRGKLADWQGFVKV